MIKELEIRVLPDELNEKASQHRELAKKLGVETNRITHSTLLRRSIDARHKRPMFLLRFRVWVDEKPSKPPAFEPPYQQVEERTPVVVVGSGPAGLFAALKLIELGLKPIVLERGTDVRARRKDIALISKGGEVNPNSNYCFGEGGAGTFSDGKLYTRATKRGDVNRILELLVYHGAHHEILIDAHPHIGTNKLPAVVSAISDTIRNFGGEILFGEQLNALEIASGAVCGVKTVKGLTIQTSAVVLATGHSARDIFTMLHKQNIRIDPKPFALGVRVEHPQELVDQVQYGQSPRHPNLPAASYALRAQVSERGVFSFCMCPGGIICPAATAPGEIVVNGWSPSKRNSRFANSGIVVEISEEDLLIKGQDPVWASLALQQEHEQRSYEAGGGGLVAPAQRLSDFISDTHSDSLPECSYHPGTKSVKLSSVFTPSINSRLVEAFREFGRQIPGYLTDQAIVVATESRTSSPIRIPRDRHSFMHPEIQGLFPCGEGAGYAGGIMSAAIDGERTAQAVKLFQA